MSRQSSLRRRLLLAGGVGLLLVSLLASALLGELFKRSARDRLDHELQQDMLTCWRRPKWMRTDSCACARTQ